jgi:S-adenosylmethionine decarboxylase proenzyme
LNDVEHLKEVLLEVAEMASTTVLDVFTHQFKPHGVSVMILIAESHLSIHTWPEHRYAAVDVFTCGEPFDERSVVQHLAAAVEAQHVSMIEIERGMLSTWANQSTTPARWSTTETLDPAEEPI